MNSSTESIDIPKRKSLISNATVNILVIQNIAIISYIYFEHQTLWGEILTDNNTNRVDKYDGRLPAKVQRGVFFPSFYMRSFWHSHAYAVWCVGVLTLAEKCNAHTRCDDNGKDFRLVPNQCERRVFSTLNLRLTLGMCVDSLSPHFSTNVEHTKSRTHISVAILCGK